MELLEKISLVYWANCRSTDSGGMSPLIKKYEQLETGVPIFRYHIFTGILSCITLF